MEQIATAMMALIANEVCKKEIDTTRFAFSNDDLKRLYCLSQNHDLAHLVGDALIKNNLISTQVRSENLEFSTKWLMLQAILVVI